MKNLPCMGGEVSYCVFDAMLQVSIPTENKRLDRIN